VFVDNVQQEPTTAFGVSGTTLTFTAAPATGTNNIYVVHRQGGASATSIENIATDLSFKTDGAVLKFGANSEITLTHDHDVGLKLKHTATADDKPIVLTLQTGETDMAANDVMGKIQFQAPDEGTGTDAILVAAAIQAVSEGDFSSSANATALQFMTGASEAATSKMVLSSAGLLSITGGLAAAGGAVFNEGSADVDFRVESNGNANMLFVDGGFDGVGIGVAPMDEQDGFTTLRIAGPLSLNVDSAGVGAGVYMGNNVYRDETNDRWEYVLGDEASQLVQANGAFTFRSAAAGSANGAITWTNNFTIAQNGAAELASGSFILGTSTLASGNLRLDHENSGGQAQFQINAHGTASFSMLSNFSGGTVNSIATGNFGLVTPHAAAISIVTGDVERIKVASAGNVVINETGANADFRVESAGNANALLIDADVNVAMFGTSTTAGDSGNSFPVVAGRFTTQTGVTSCANNTATTLMTFNSNDGNFLVSARLSGTGAITDNTTGIVHVNNSASGYTLLAAGSNVVLSMSGLALRVTQTAGSTLNLSWNVIRISR